MAMSEVLTRDTQPVDLSVDEFVAEEEQRTGAAETEAVATAELKSRRVTNVANKIGNAVLRIGKKRMAIITGTTLGSAATLIVAPEAAPVIGALSGGLIGSTVEQSLTEAAEEEHAPVAELFGEANTEAEIERHRIKEFAGKYVGPLAVVAAGFGLFNGFAWKPTHAVKHKNDIKFLVDRSGETKHQNGGFPADAISKVLAKFDQKSGDYRMTAEVAKSDGHHPDNKLSQAISESPFWGAPMDDAYDSVIGGSESSSKDTSGDQPKVPLVILTNGNKIGKESDVIQKANRAGTADYIIDVSKQTDTTTEASFKKITWKTKGHFWDAGSALKDNIVGKVTKNLGPRIEKRKNSFGLPSKILLAMVSIGAAGWVAKDRRRMPMTFNGTNFK
jgi:hypothetical protein